MQKEQIRRHAGANTHRGLPSSVIWDITYACPLRCTHCYTESGRRASRQLSSGDVVRVADKLVEMGIKALFLSGGEPLLVKGLGQAMERWAAASISVYLFTSGWLLDRASMESLVPMLAATHVSVDGATAETHDRIRQRAGSFGRAMDALGLLDAESARRRAAKKPRIQFGVDCTVIQSNLAEVPRILEELPKRFPEMSFINIGAAVPAGVASTPWFAEHELLSEAQLAELIALRDHPLDIPMLVSISDQKNLQMHPDDVANGTANVDTLSIEPDGAVRAMSMYEGTVGNILEDRPEELWRRVQERWHDPFVVTQLTAARTRAAWAAAVRAIDSRFAAPHDEERIKQHLVVL